MRDALRLERADRRERSENSVAIVGAAPAVELAVLEQRLPGPVALTPAAHLRLLVEMAVEQDRAMVVFALGRYVEVQQGRAAGQSHDLQLEPAHGLFLHPRLGQPDDALDVPVGFPLRIEMRRLRRNTDIVGELGDDLGVPLSGNRGK